MKKYFTFIAFLLLTSTAHAQSWTGLIDPARAIDWTGAGVTGGIPSGSWTQCGATIAAYSGTAATINTALAACPAHQFVLLGAGNFNLTSAIVITNQSLLALRGSGANSTFLIFSAGASNSCGGALPSTVCIISSRGAFWVSDANYATWTAGFARGSSVLTFSNVAGLVANQSLILLDQCADGMSGYPCTSGTGNIMTTQLDNGNWFNCDEGYVSAWSSLITYAHNAYATSGGFVYQSSNAANNLNHLVSDTSWWAQITTTANPTFGCGSNGANAGNQRFHRPQVEMFEISNVNAATKEVTIAGTLRNPNYNLSYTPAVAVALNPAINVGIENLSIDNSALSADCVAGVYIAESWVSGIRCVKPAKYGVVWMFGAHNTVKDNYFFSTSVSTAGDSTMEGGISTSDTLTQNNIAQGIKLRDFTEGADTGSVWSYNFNINQYNNSPNLQQASSQHGGDRWQLFEGNITNQYYGEIIHGPKMGQTLYREFLTGFESCSNVGCGASGFKGNGGGTAAVRLASFNRFHNILLSVLGTPGYDTGYIGTSLFGDGNVYMSGPSGVTVLDPLVLSSLYRYGNADAKTGFANTRWCGSVLNTGWVALCGSASEVPTGFSPYGQPLPTVGDVAAGQAAAPASLYLSGKPSWFNSIPWPAQGGDVSGGNVGQCNGTFGVGVANVAGQFGGVAALNSGNCTGTSFNSAAFGGRVNANPAMACFLNTMGGLPDGSNGVLAFNPTNCYTASTQPVVSLTTFPMGFGSSTVGVPTGASTATLKNTGTATLTYTAITVTGTNAADFTITGGTCNVGGSTLTAGSSCTVTGVFTPGNTGARTANLTVTSNAASSPDNGVMTGTGQAAVANNTGINPQGQVY